MSRSKRGFQVVWLMALFLGLGTAAWGGADKPAKSKSKGPQAPKLLPNPNHGPDDKGHTLAVYAVAFSPDGKTVASASRDRTVKLWDPDTAQVRITLNGHNDRVASVAFSPDGKTLFSGGRDRAVKLWDVATGRVRATLIGSHDLGGHLALSPDGKTLAVSGLAHVIWIWDVPTRTQLRSLKGHRNTLRELKFSPDGKTLASVSKDFTVRLWDPTGAAEPRVLNGHTDEVHCLAYSPDGKTLATGSSDRTVRLWDTTSGEPKKVIPCSTAVSSVAFAPDGKTLAISLTNLRSVAAKPGLVLLRELDSGADRGKLIGHTLNVWQIAFSPTGDRIATASDDGRVRLWDPVTTTPQRMLAGFFKPIRGIPHVMRHGGGVRGLAFSRDGRRLASVGEDMATTIWDAETKADLHTLDQFRHKLRAVAYSPLGDLVASAGEDGTIVLDNPTDGRRIGTLAGHLGSINGLAFSPDGKTLAAGRANAVVQLWDVAARKEVATLNRHTGPVNSLAFAPDGKSLATASEDLTVKVWDLADRSLLANLEGHGGRITAVAFAPDGKSLASSDADGLVILWDPEAESPRARLRGHTGGVFALAYSPDGTALVSGDHNGTINRWDAGSGHQVCSHVAAHEGAVWTLAFRPDGKELASGGADCSIKFWDFAKDFAPTRFVGHPQGVARVKVSPDGKTVATGGSGESTVRLWDAESGQQRASLEGHFGSIEDLEFSPDGKILVSTAIGRGRYLRPKVSGQDPPERVKIWETATGKALAPLGGKTGDAMSLAFSPDGTRLVTGNNPASVVIWDVESRQIYRTLRFPEGTPKFAKFPVDVYDYMMEFRDHWVNRVAYAPDGRTVWAGDHYGTIWAWDVESGEIRSQWRGHLKGISNLKLSPDGKILVTTSADRTVRLWNVADASPLADLSEMPQPVRSPTFSPDGHTLAVIGSNANSIYFCDVASRKVRWVLEKPAGSDDVFYDLDYAPDGKHLYVVTYRSVQEFDPTPGGPDLRPFAPVKGQELASLVGHRDTVQDLRFTPDGRTLISRSDDGTIKLWDVAKRGGLATLAVESSLITAWDLAPDGKILATGNLKSTPPYTAEIRLWDLESGRPLDVVAGTETWIHSLKFSADGRSLASTENGSLNFSVHTQSLVSAENENVLRFWDARTLAPLEAADTPEKFPLALERPAAGPTLAVLSHLGTAELWGFDTRKRRATLVYKDGGQDFRPFAARFSPDGKVLATGSGKPIEVVDRRRFISGIVKLFDVETGREEATLLGQDGPIGCLAFTPDSETLASGSPFNSLVLWDVPGRALKARLSGHEDKVLAIAFSPDGQTLASVSSDRTLRLWNAQSGRVQKVYLGHTDGIRTLAFSPDGALIATGGYDRMVKLWNARPIPTKKR